MIIAYYPGGGGNRYLQRLLGNEWNQFNKSYDINNPGQQYEYRYLISSVQTPKTDHILTHCMNSTHIQQCLPLMPVVFIKSDLQSSLRREWILHGHQRYSNRNIKNTVSRLEHYRVFKDPSWPVIENESEIDQLPYDIQQEIFLDYDQIVNSHFTKVPGILTALTQNLIDKINSAYEIICWHQEYYQKYPIDFSIAEQIIDIDTDNNEFALLMRHELNLYQSEIFDQVWNAING